MSTMLKCPNPSCSYVFDPSLVPTGVVLSCPMCARQFTLGPPQPAPGAPPAQPGYPAQAPPPPPPVDPDFEAVGRTAVEDRDPDRMLPSRGTNKAQVYILAGVTCVCLALGALAVIFKVMMRNEPEPTPTDSFVRYKDENLGRDPLPTGWADDDALRVRLGSPYFAAFKRENPEAYFAVGSHDPKNFRQPRQRKVLADLERPFPRMFLRESLSKESPVAPNWLGATIAPPQGELYPNGFKFRAQSPDGLSWAGEAYTVTHQGMAYYWLGWCKETDFDDLKSEFATIRGKFRTLETRKDWKEKQLNVVDYKGDTVAYTISDADPDPKDSWKELPASVIEELKKFEPDLDRRLEIASVPDGDRRGLPDKAELSVFIIDGSGDPLQAARAHVEGLETARVKSAGGDYKVTFTELKDDPQGEPIPAAGVPQNTPAVRLKTNVEGSKSANRLIVASGIQVGGKVVVAQCWCELGKRSVFETKFLQIAKSLR